jgi:uncharacterized membrane protein HdeD (DUF308 family)
MPLTAARPLTPADREMLRRTWGGFVAFGVIIVLLGLLGLAFTGVFTLGIVALLGWVFAISGAVEIVHAVVRKGWAGFWVDLVSGLLTLGAGVMIILQPVAAVAVLTVLIGIVFVIGGIFRLWAGAAIRTPYGTWVVLHGIVSALLGVMILAEWPFSSVWVIGTLVSIDLLFNGARMIALGLAARKWPATADD